MAKTKIKRIEIEVADDGGFMVEVRRCPAEKPEPKNGSIPYVPDEVTKHVQADVSDLTKFLGSIFPSATGNSRKGKESSEKLGSTTLDSYEGSSGYVEED